jgi:hypothetical protein
VSLRFFIRIIPILVIPFFLSSCFLIKIRIPITSVPIKDTVHVYHLILSSNSKKLADSNTVHAFKKESKEALDWITKEGHKYGQTLVFKEHWLTNKDTTRKNTFIHKLPSKSLNVLSRRRTFKIVTRKKTRKQEEKIEPVNWKRAMFDSLGKQVSDTVIGKKIGIANKRSTIYNKNQLIMVHLLKAKKSKVLGFYKAGKIYLGKNRSETIAHETIHHLGAPDLYMHRFWLGKRRRIVKKELKQEIMNGSIAKNYVVDTYYMSNYTAYTIGWTNQLNPEYKPILKENLMTRFMFYFWLLF